MLCSLSVFCLGLRIPSLGAAFLCVSLPQLGVYAHVFVFTPFCTSVLHEKAVQIETAVTRGDHRSHRVLRLMLGSREGRKQALSVSELVRDVIPTTVSWRPY